jgi:hypothetical protein
MRRAIIACVALLSALPVLATRLEGQAPISIKILDVEKDDTLLSTASLRAPGSSAENVSDKCRRQFQEAKTQNPNLVSFGCFFPVLRLKTSAMATEYFGGLEVGNALALTFGDDQRTLYTELLSDNLWLSSGLGYARVGLSAQVAGSDAQEPSPDPAVEDAEGTTVDQLFQGGGNAMLTVTLPTTVWINFVGETDADRSPIRAFDSFLSLGVGADIPELNAAVDTKSGNARFGWQGRFSWRTFNEDFRFFAVGTAAWVIGFNDGFYNDLVGHEVERPGSGLGLAGGTVGVEIGKIARVGLAFGGTTLEGARQKPRLSIQLMDRK